MTYSRYVEQAAEPQGKVKYQAIDRSQVRWEQLDIEELIPQNHAARVIWEVSGKFDFGRFEAASKTREDEAGRPCWPPRLL